MTEITLRVPNELAQMIRKYARQFIVEGKGETITPSARDESFEVPTKDDVVAECKRIHSPVNPDRFYNYYTERKWMNKDGTTFDWKEKLKSWGTYNLEKTPVGNSKAKQTYDMSVKSADVKAFMEGL